MTQQLPPEGVAPGPDGLHQLTHLRLPVMAGKRFLDIACGRGFFCGYAAHAGALRSVGVDASEGNVQQARIRFPHCEFIHGREAIPGGPFDVILLASNWDPTEDPAAMLHALTSNLSTDGVLVMEIGVASSTKSEWVRANRGSQLRSFPSMLMVREVLEGYAWKWMGPGAPVDGDPVKRQVFHISRRRPLAYLLMQPPAYGKTSIAKTMFGPGQVVVVSGDELVAHIARGKNDADAGLSVLVSEDFSPFRLDAAIRKAFDGGAGARLVEACISRAGKGDFALDMYVPQERQALVEQLVADAGYLPIVLRWSRPGAALPSQEETARQAEAFCLSLAGPSTHAMAVATNAPWLPAGCGFLDEVAYDEGRLVLRGWAVNKDGDMPGQISVGIDDRVLLVGNFERQIRQDVQRSLGLPHALLGYRITLDVPGLKLRSIARSLRLQIPDGAVFGRSGPLEQMLSAEH